MSNYKDRVVVTGIGIICANGKNVEEFWRNVTDNKSGIRLVSTIPMSGINTEYAGEIDGYNPDDHFAPKEAEKYDIAGQLSIIAAREAAQVAKYDLAASDPYRVGVILGTSLGGMRSGEQFHEQWVKEGIENADPSLLYNYVIHIPVDSVSHYMKLKGPKSVISNACAAGTNSIGYAADIIRSGKADAMFAGGVDPLCRLSMSGFNTLGALAPEPCAPFSKSNGLNIGEGAGVLLLERMDLALERGATILGEVLSYALSADAYHITAPDPAGAGGMRSMRRTLEKAALPETAVDYVNGHGTGTNANDSSEPIGVRTLFGHDVPVSSTKSMIGHMLGAAGASEGVISVLAINDSFIPATINFDHEADKFKELDFVRDTGRTKELDTVMSNSFAFGGNNASLLLGKFKQDREVPAVPAKKRALITGLGALAGNSANAEELFAKFQAGENTFSPIENFDTERYVSTHGAQIPEVPYRKLVNPALLRRMDDLGKQATAVTKMALDDAKLKIDSKNSERVGVLFATGTGPLKTVEAFNRTVILKGAEAAEALLFPNTVMNAAAGHICLNFKIKGPTTTITSGGTAGINALFYATQLIQYGDADAVIVVTGDEFNETMVAGHSRVPGYLTAGNSSKPFGAGLDGTVLGEACVAFVVESEESALARGAKVYGELKGFGLTSDSSGPARVSRKGEEWAKSFELAVQEAGLTFDQVDYVAASASGNRVFDTAEARALRQVIGNKAPVSAPKGYFGEALASSGMLGALSALYAIERNNIPQIPGVEQAFSEAEGLDLVIGSNRERAVQHALVSSFSFGGNYQSLVIGRYEK